MSGLEWMAPGPGLWQRDLVHWPSPAARILTDVFIEPCQAGFARAFARYGAPFETLQVAAVNDVLYFRLAEITNPERLAARSESAREAVERKLWTDDVEAWEEVTKPARVAAHGCLQAVDLPALSTTQFVQHVRDIVTNAVAAVIEHMELVPVGDVVGYYLVAASERGVGVGEAMALLRGASPGSVEGNSAIAAIAAALVEAGCPNPTSLEEIRRAGAAPAHALDSYLALHGWRMLTTYGPDGLAVTEIPDLILRAIRASIEAPLPSLVPQGTHGDAELDVLLKDARRAYGVRDDNEGVTLLWAMGLVRRMLLEAGRRLTDQGALDDPSDVFALSATEIEQWLVQNADPSRAGEAASRQLRKMSLNESWLADAGVIPECLGAEPNAPLDPFLLPAAAAMAFAARMAIWDAESLTSGSMLADGTMSGIGIGDTVYTGPACVGSDAGEAIMRVQPGDVLIVPFTTSSCNAVLSIAGALVTTAGGPASHAALVARELGLPTVVGAKDAMRTIHNGDMVTVDPIAGIVRREVR